MNEETHISGGKGTILIQELSTPGCASCAAAKKVLDEEIKTQFPGVEIEHVDMLSERGQKMAQEFEVMSSPGIIVNGELFSMGGLDKDKLVEKIKSLSN